MPNDSADVTHVLVVEDDPAQAQFIGEALTEAQPLWQVKLARNGAECRRCLDDESYDALVLDYVLPDEDGLSLLRSARERFPDAVIVFMTAFGGEEVAAEALRAGADDYVAKTGSWLEVLSVATERCLSIRATTREYYEKLRSCETILDHAADLMFIIGAEGGLEFIAGPTRELLGYEPEELVEAESGPRPLGWGQVPEVMAAIRRLVQAGEGTEHLELPLVRKGGSDIWLRASLSPRVDEDGNAVGVVGTAQDITQELATARELDRRNSELACLQAVTSALHGSLEVETAMEAAVSELVAHALADAAGVTLPMEDGEGIEYQAQAGFTEETVAAYEQRPHRVGEALAGAPLVKGEPVIFGPEEIASGTLHPEPLLAQGLSQGLAVPILLQGDIIGSLIVMRSDEPYDERDAQLLASVAEQIATTADTAQVHEEVALALAGANRLLDVTLAINAHRQLEEVLHSVAQAAVEVCNALSAAVLIPDESGEKSQVVLAAPAEAEERTASRQPRPNGIANETLERGEMLFVTANDESGPRIRQADLELGVKSVISLPLMEAERPFGVLAVHRDDLRPLDQVHMRTLQMLAAQAAQAIDNTSLLQRAQHSEALYRELFEHSGVPTVVFAQGGMIKMVNVHFEELSGYSREELQNKLTMFDLIHEQDRDRLREAHMRGREPGAPSARLHSFRGVRKDGEVRWLQAALHIMPDGNTVTAVIIDTTEARQLERRVLQSEKAAALGQLVSGVAHELNNPLTAILGYSQLIQACDDGGIRGQGAAIEQEARRSEKIIEGLLSFARERPTVMAATGVNVVLDKALQMPAYRMNVDNIRVHTRYDNSIPLIQADPHQLQQVFLNIINNAHYAMRDSSEGGDLLVRSENLGEFARVTIKDTGPGMTEEEARQAFDPFFTTKEVGEGTGLGLSVSQGIIEGHGGNIALETAPGEGTIVVVELPVITPVEEEKAAEPIQEAVGANVAGRVLVVDDEQTLLNLVQQALEAQGHHVDTALAVTDAMRLLEAYEYDVILSDLRMPGLDGEYLLNHIADTHPELTRRFVVITGDTVAADTLALLERPDIRSLAKPFGIQELRRTVTEVIESERRE